MERAGTKWNSKGGKYGIRVVIRVTEIVNGTARMVNGTASVFRGTEGQ